jgi:hypothetical protein
MRPVKEKMGRNRRSDATEEDTKRKTREEE